MPVSHVGDSTETLHAQFRPLTIKASYLGALAAFIVIIATIVLVSSGLVLLLPGVNAMEDVVLPAMLPASLALLATIPLIVKCFTLSKQKRILRSKLFSAIKNDFNSFDFMSMDKKEGAKAIATLFPLNAHHLYKKQFILDLLQEFPKERLTEEQKRAKSAIEEYLKSLAGKKVKDKD